jgi:hypothetical protein
LKLPLNIINYYIFTRDRVSPSRAADPHHFNADPDPAFTGYINADPEPEKKLGKVADPHHFNADLYPDPAFHFNADPHPAPRQAK